MGDLMAMLENFPEGKRLMAIGEENRKVSGGSVVVSDDNRVHQGRRLHLHRRVVWPVRRFLVGGSRCLSLAAHHLRHCE